MSLSDNNKNRGAHGDSSFMLGRSRPSSENPPALAVGSVKYYNLCFVKHNKKDRRAYLYQLPLSEEVNPGENLYVRDRHGDHTVTAFAESFLCSKKLTKVLCEANGGYFPPAEIIGRVGYEVKSYDVLRTFDGQTIRLDDCDENPGLPF